MDCSGDGTGGTFVATGNVGTIATSPDGFDWELQSIGIRTELTGVAHHDLSLDRGRRPGVPRSPQSTTRSGLSAPPVLPHDTLSSLEYAFGEFYASSSSGNLIRTDNGLGLGVGG